MDPGPGPEGPWALWPQYLAGKSEQLERKLNVFYWELAGYCWVSEAATAPHTLELPGGMQWSKWHLVFMKVVRVLVDYKLLSTDTQHQEEV